MVTCSKTYLNEELHRIVVGRDIMKGQQFIDKFSEFHFIDATINLPERDGGRFPALMMLNCIKSGLKASVTISDYISST